MTLRTDSGERKVLVSGSSGFIGGYVVEDLLGRGHTVVGIDNLSKYGRVEKSYDDHPRYTLVEGDCRDVELMTKLLMDCEHFVAGAALIGGISYFHTFAYDLLATNERIMAASCDAAIAASEKVDARQPATADAAALARESAEGELPGLLVDGPFGYDVALSRKAAEAKGLAASAVAGQADLILFPNIESGNATVKAWKLHGGARTGSLVLGATVPVLLNSRSDGPDRRVLGLVMAQALRAGQEDQP